MEFYFVYLAKISGDPAEKRANATMAVEKIASDVALHLRIA
jgi:hypothetical protein